MTDDTLVVHSEGLGCDLGGSGVVAGQPSAEPIRPAPTIPVVAMPPRTSMSDD